MEFQELSYKELQALVQELEMEDEALQKSVNSLSLTIDKEEALDFIDDSEDETEDYSDVTAKLNAVEGFSINKNLRNKALKERAAKYRIRIQRLAVNQNILKLSDIIPDYDLQLLIKFLTSKQLEIAGKASESVNKRLKRLLNSLIPIPIRRLYLSYPWVVRRCPGFTYSCDFDYVDYHSPNGQEVVFWATPDVPYYFRQGTEVNVLISYRGELLHLVNKAVRTYFKYQNAQEARALNIASRLIKNKVKTYFDLLMYNPRWFEIIYNLANGSKSNETQTSGTI